MLIFAGKKSKNKHESHVIPSLRISSEFSHAFELWILKHPNQEEKNSNKYFFPNSFLVGIPRGSCQKWAFHKN